MRKCWLGAMRASDAAMTDGTPVTYTKPNSSRAWRSASQHGLKVGENDEEEEEESWMRGDTSTTGTLWPDAAEDMPGGWQKKWDGARGKGRNAFAETQTQMGVCQCNV